MPMTVPNPNRDEHVTTQAEADSTLGAEDFNETDAVDDLLRVHLPVRRWQVDVEETALCPVELHNAGDMTAEFRVAVTDSNGPPLNPAWIRLTPAQIRLAPDARSSMILALTPPRSPHSRAGAHDLTIRITSPQHPDRASHISATLTVNPFTQIQVDPPAPSHVTVSWRKPQADLVLAVENQGNHEISLSVDVGAADGGRGILAHATLLNGDQEQDALRLEPGRRRHVSLHLACRPAAMWGFSPRSVFLAMLVKADNAPASTVLAEMTVAPFLASARLVTSAALAMMALLAAGLVGGLTWLSVASPPGLPPTPNPAAATRQVDAVTQQLDTRIIVVPPDHLPIADAPPAPAQPSTDPPPVVSAETAPIPAPPLTYEAMFQEIAEEYGLSWQMLAAQAYVESKLDPDALGRDGDMGLMQVIPATWGQWAPRVGVDVAAPYDAYANVRVGAAYLAYLRDALTEAGFPEDAWALAAYNWGLTNVRRVINSGQGWEGLPRKQRQYVTDILNLAGSLGE